MSRVASASQSHGAVHCIAKVQDTALYYPILQTNRLATSLLTCDATRQVRLRCVRACADRASDETSLFSLVSTALACVSRLSTLNWLRRRRRPGSKKRKARKGKGKGTGKAGWSPYPPGSQVSRQSSVAAQRSKIGRRRQKEGGPAVVTSQPEGPGAGPSLQHGSDHEMR